MRPGFTGCDGATAGQADVIRLQLMMLAILQALSRSLADANSLDARFRAIVLDRFEPSEIHWPSDVFAKSGQLLEGLRMTCLHIDHLF